MFSTLRAPIYTLEMLHNWFLGRNKRDEFLVHHVDSELAHH